MVYTILQDNTNMIGRDGKQMPNWYLHSQEEQQKFLDDYAWFNTSDVDYVLQNLRRFLSDSDFIVYQTGRKVE